MASTLQKTAADSSTTAVHVCSSWGQLHPDHVITHSCILITNAQARALIGRCAEGSACKMITLDGMYVQQYYCMRFL